MRTFLLRKRIAYLYCGLFLAFGIFMTGGERISRAVSPGAGEIVAETAKLFDSTITRVGKFGSSVAISGDRLAVGAPFDHTGPDNTDGAVSVYVRGNSGWTLQQKLYHNNRWSNDTFGTAVAISGDTLVVGAPNGDIGGGPNTSSDTNEGHALVYRRSNGKWEQQQLLHATDGQANDLFGSYVAISGDTIVVGNNDVSGVRQGDYIFTRDGAVWSQQQKLNGSGPAAIFGDTLAIQARVGLEERSVQVYARNGSVWERRQELAGDPSATINGTSFGGSIALSENHLVVGAPYESAGENDSEEGRVYVFERSGAGWVRRQKLAAADSATNDHFGHSTAVFGDTIVVGTLYDTSSARPEPGAAYVFKPNGASWAQHQKLGPSDGAKGNRFGESVAASGGAILVGASENGKTITPGQFPYIPGAAYVFAAPVTAPQSVTNVSAASYTGDSLAPESIAVAFGSGLATTTQAASGSLPTSIAGTTVKIKDSAGTERMSPLFFVSPSQINYLIPKGTASGTATVTVTSGDGSVSSAGLQIEPVAPGLFSADSSGQGMAAAVVLHVKADSSQAFEPAARLEGDKIVPVPIDLGPESDRVVLVLFGTGIHNLSSFSAVMATIGGTKVPVAFAGDAPGFIGLDQVNLGPLPRSLAGRGEVDVVLTVDGKVANTVKIHIK